MASKNKNMKFSNELNINIKIKIIILMYTNLNLYYIGYRLKCKYRASLLTDPNLVFMCIQCTLSRAKLALEDFYCVDCHPRVE